MAENTGLLSADVSAGDDATAAQYNNLRADAKKMRQEEFNAGATINGATLPVPVYQNTTDNEVYACDANVTTKLNFIGFAITNAVDAGAIIVQHTGIVGGFTGLDEGEKYYVQDAVGTIGKDKGTYKILVGIAISATELLIINDNEYSPIIELSASDTLQISADTEETYNASDAWTKMKSIRIRKYGTIRVKFDSKDTVGGGNARIYKNGVAHGTQQTVTGTYQTFSEDLTFDIRDTIELWVTRGAEGTVYVKNFRLYYTEDEKAIATVEDA